MSRPYKKQTSYENSGEQNMGEILKKEKYHAKTEKEKETLSSIQVLAHKAFLGTRPTNWSEEELVKSLVEYFDFCSTRDFKPSKASLRLWLGVSRAQYYSWETESTKYGIISDLINRANDAMEVTYVQNIESRPTGNIFLLKTCHGYKETTNVEINNQSTANTDDVKHLVSKLGLDNSIEDKKS